MAQFYLLSVLTLLLAGALAASDFLGERFGSLSVLSDITERRSLMLTIGSLTSAVGVMKFFIRAPFDTVPVAGDLLPAVVGIVTGAVLLLRRADDQGGDETPRSPMTVLVEYRNPIGLAAIITGLLHFLFAAAVIL